MTTKPCPICRQPAIPAFQPFCGQRCADLDLGRWLRGAYTVAVPMAEGDENPAGTGISDATDADKN